MRVRKALEWFGGSVLVYVLAAACSGAEGQRSANSGQDGGTATGSTGTGGLASGGTDPTANGGAMGGTSVLDAAVDAIVDPVPDADAQTLPPEAVEETCSKTVTLGSYTYAFAEHEYAGKTKEELAGVRVLIHQVMVDNTGYPLPAGYEWRESIWGNLMRDGAVAAICGQWPTAGGPQPTFADAAIFIGP
jgi:hypothetical protein